VAGPDPGAGYRPVRRVGLGPEDYIISGKGRDWRINPHGLDDLIKAGTRPPPFGQKG
jgi:hypothetical protein